VGVRKESLSQRSAVNKWTGLPLQGLESRTLEQAVPSFVCLPKCHPTFELNSIFNCSYFDPD
jgi:hypothetical protein